MSPCNFYVSNCLKWWPILRSISHPPGLEWLDELILLDRKVWNHLDLNARKIFVTYPTLEHFCNEYFPEKLENRIGEKYSNLVFLNIVSRTLEFTGVRMVRFIISKMTMTSSSIHSQSVEPNKRVLDRVAFS